MSHLVKTDPLMQMCCVIALAINVNFPANSHHWSRVHSPMYLLLHLLRDRIEQNRFSPTQLSGRPFALPQVCAHVQS